MSQDFTGARIVAGSGGSGGGRGGDVGSHNRWDSSTRNSNNDNSVRQRIKGDNYSGPVDKGDNFNGAISNSAVGGRGNTNSIHNQGSPEPSRPSQVLTPREIELGLRLEQARKRMEAKKERERLKKLEDELKAMEAELGDDD